MLFPYSIDVFAKLFIVNGHAEPPSHLLSIVCELCENENDVKDNNNYKVNFLIT